MVHQAMEILKWTFLAQRGLKLEELRHALAVEPEDTELDWDNFVDAERSLDCCLGLVIIDDSTSTVRLVHKSLQDYLKTEYEQNHLFEHGHYEISRICLTYMSFDSYNRLQTVPSVESSVSCERCRFIDGHT
jgi:hypothetical protein